MHKQTRIVNYSIASHGNSPSKPLQNLNHQSPEQCSSYRVNWRERIKLSNSKNCTIFHKRNNTNMTQATEHQSNIQNLSLENLKNQLQNKNRYLQELIQQIVVHEELHKQQLSQIDQDYEQQISEMHEMLKTQIEKNRHLQKRLEKSSCSSSSRTSPVKSSNDSLLLYDDNYQPNLY